MPKVARHQAERRDPRGHLKMLTASELGTRIRRARERKRWTQQQLADALGVSVRAIGNWERDEAVPRNTIGALEELLGVDLTNDEPGAA